LCPHLHENPQPIRTRWFDVQCWALVVGESPFQISRGEKPSMNRKKIAWGILFAGVVVFAGTLVSEPFSAAQTRPSATAIQLDATEGTKVAYRVREQLAGINFPDDAVGSTDSVTGGLVVLPDGSIDAARSKLTIDLRTLKSDQDMRDGYVKNRTLETDKFPTAEFVARRLEGVPSPLPAPERATGQSGFQLVGDLTVHGVTKEVTLNGYATFSRDLVAGRAMTDFTFSTFGLTKPSLARLLSVDDKIQLELDFKLKRTN
jgi:polyisoprenoid-binding protein YceI